MALVRNISKGPRGTYFKGVFVMVDPGKTIEADDYPEDSFSVVGDEPEGYTSVGDLSTGELVELAITEGVIDDVDAFKRSLSQAIDAKRAAAIMAVSEGEDAAGTFDHDGDGEDGGSKPQDPPALSGKNKAELLDLAKAENVEADDSMTVADIKAAIEQGREA